MVAGGIALFLVGYVLLYSGASQMATGGKGWGIWESATGHGLGEGGAGGAEGSGSIPRRWGNSSAFDALFENIKPMGNSGAAVPTTGQSPVTGAQQV